MNKFPIVITTISLYVSTQSQTLTGFTQCNRKFYSLTSCFYPPFLSLCMSSLKNTTEPKTVIHCYTGFQTKHSGAMILYKHLCKQSAAARQIQAVKYTKRFYDEIQERFCIFKVIDVRILRLHPAMKLHAEEI